MSEFEDLLKPTTTESISSLKDEVKRSGGYSRDERFWVPKIEEGGGGIIRFMPHPPGEDKNFIKIYKHKVDMLGVKCFKYSPITIGKEDPLVEHSNEYFEDSEDYARKFWPQKRYFANIYIIEDKAKPDNEGKVFLYSFGQQIFEILTKAYEPTSDRVEPINPYNLMDGADFLLNIHMKKDGKNNYPQFTQSQFLPKGPLLDGDIDKIKEAWKSCYSLEEFLDEDKFPKYDELGTVLDKILKKEGKTTKFGETKSKTGEDEIVEKELAASADMEENKNLQDDLEKDILGEDTKDPKDVLSKDSSSELDDLDLDSLDDLDLDDL